jgi:hypothetical protein
MQARLQVSVLFAESDEIRPVQCGERLAKASGGKQSLCEVGAVNDDDIHVAGELAMLEAVVQKMKGGEMNRRAFASYVFRQQPGMVTACSDKDWHLGAAGDEQRLIAEAIGVSGRIDLFGGPGGAPIASGEDIDGHPFGGEQLSQPDGQRGFSRTPNRKIADADDRPA